MADEEHVEILLQGVEVWNQWRAENPGIKPDLSDADLGAYNLSGADFSGTDFRRATIVDAKFRIPGSRMLISAVPILPMLTLTARIFTKPYLSEAKLHYGKFNDASFQRMDLDDADF